MNQLQIDLRVKVELEWLKKVVLKNREEHKEVYDKAFARYQAALVAAIEQQLQEIRDNKRTTMTYFQGYRPEDHTVDYDLVLSMLRNSQEKEISITGSDYRRFVQDRWDWTDQFVAASNSYGVQTKFDNSVEPIE